MNNKNPSKNDIIEALNKSGYLLEQSLVPVLEDFGFITSTNYHYLDPDDGTSREMDLKGYALKKISQRWLSHYLSITLIVSCRASTNPFVFFEHKTVVPAEYIGGDFFMLSNPEKIPGTEDEPVDIQEYINLRKFHHYYKSSTVATQFCEIVFNEKSKKFDSRHDEYKSEILPLIKAMDFEIKKVRKEELNKEVINIHTFYPVIVLGGGLYTCSVNNNQPQLQNTQHISYLQDYNSKTLKGEFRIDIVTKKYLEKLLKQVDSETDEIVKRINKRRNNLLVVIKKQNKK